MAILLIVVGTILWENSYSIDKVIAAPMDSLADAWSKAYGNHLLEGIGVVFLWVPLACAIFILLSASTHLVDIHRAGSAAVSFGVASRVASASLWPAMVLILGCCIGGSVLQHVFQRHPELGNSISVPPWPLVLVPGIPFCGLLLAAWTRRAIDGAVSEPRSMEFEPRCEGCGYNLMHRPADGICPECGLTVESSLQPSVRRPGSRWERTMNVGIWLRTVADIIINPRGHYSRLQLRTPFFAAQRFARFQIILIGAGTYLWLVMIFFNLSKLRLRSGEIVFFSITGALLAAFAGWGLHRLIAGIVVLAWIRKKALPDFFGRAKSFVMKPRFVGVLPVQRLLFHGGVHVQRPLAGESGATMAGSSLIYSRHAP
jgi:hypothetical protein